MEDFGYRPVTSVTHASIHAGQEFPTTLIAQKQIYASHYFWAKLNVSALFDDPQGKNQPAMHFVYLDHSLFDDKLGRANRFLLKRGVRKNLRSRLESLRERLEARYRTVGELRLQ